MYYSLHTNIDLNLITAYQPGFKTGSLGPKAASLQLCYAPLTLFSFLFFVLSLCFVLLIYLFLFSIFLWLLLSSLLYFFLLFFLYFSNVSSSFAVVFSKIMLFDEIFYLSSFFSVPLSLFCFLSLSLSFSLFFSGNLLPFYIPHLPSI